MCIRAFVFDVRKDSICGFNVTVENERRIFHPTYYDYMLHGSSSLRDNQTTLTLTVKNKGKNDISFDIRLSV